MLVLLIFCLLLLHYIFFNVLFEYVTICNSRILNSTIKIDGGDDKNRTRDPLRARQML